MYYQCFAEAKYYIHIK